MSTQYLKLEFYIQYISKKGIAPDYVLKFFLSEPAYNLFLWLKSRNTIEKSKKVNRYSKSGQMLDFYEVDLGKWTHPASSSHLLKYYLDELQSKNLIEYYVTS